MGNDNEDEYESVDEDEEMNEWFITYFKCYFQTLKV